MNPTVTFRWQNKVLLDAKAGEAYRTRCGLKEQIHFPRN
jgi:hypothetical protein